MKRLNRVFALLLSVLLCFGIFPAGVLADENIVPIEIVLETDISKRDDTVTAKVYVSEDVDFDTVGYSVKYNTENAVLLYSEEAENIRVARTKKDADAGILARSLYVSAGKTMTAEEGRILIDTVTFRMIEDGMVGVEFGVVEKDADFGRTSTYLINGGSYYSTEGKVSYIATADELLEKTKEEAKAELENYKDPADYRAAQKTELSEAVRAGIEDIDRAKTAEDVQQALNEAKAVIDDIKTDSQLRAEEEASHEHNYGEWKVTKNATCTEKGEEKRVCACGEAETREIEMKAHTQKVVGKIEATCEKAGYTGDTVCDVCDSKLATGKVVDKIAHTEVAIEGKAANCTETGLTEGKKCTVCGTVTVKQEEIAARGHKEEVLQGKAATCTEAGLTEGKKCTVCGTVTVAQEEIAALGHMEEIIPGKPATETVTGLTEGKKCSVCGEIIVKQEEIPVLEKEYTLGDVNGDGKVNALDATQILRYANNKASVLSGVEEDTALFKAADVNADGKINALDATQILRYANNKASVFDK